MWIAGGELGRVFLLAEYGYDVGELGHRRLVSSKVPQNLVVGLLLTCFWSIRADHRAPALGAGADEFRCPLRMAVAKWRGGRVTGCVYPIIRSVGGQPYVSFINSIKARLIGIASIRPLLHFDHLDLLEHFEAVATRCEKDNIARTEYSTFEIPPLPIIEVDS